MRVDLARIRERVGNVRSDFAVLVVVGVLVGIGSGLAGVALHFGLHHLGPTLLFDRATRIGKIFGALLPAIGAGLAWAFLHLWMRVREQSIGEVIWAATRGGGHMPRHGTFTQMVGSWLTVGSGGSAGPEGPIAYSGAAIGSNIATWLGLSERRRVSLLGCGVAGAISSIFNAPVTGMLFALEVVLGEWVSFNILPIAISSVVANVLASTMRPGEPILHLEGVLGIQYVDYLLLLGVAAMTGVGSSLLQRSVRLFSWIFRRLHRPMLWKPIVGGLCVGMIGLEVPLILGEGYAAIQDTFSGPVHGAVWGIGLVAVVKIVATGLTLGSGGVGGIFAPSLFIGAYLGLFYHQLLTGAHVLDNEAPQHAAIYALIGMAGMLGGTLHAPLTAIFLVAEITGNYNLLLPLILVTASSHLVAQWLEPAGLYAKELAEEHGSPRATHLDSRILADISLEEIVVPPDAILHESQRIDEIEYDIQRSDHDLFPVTDSDGKHVGVLRAHFLFGHDPEVQQLILVSDVMDASWPKVRIDTSIADLLPLIEDVAVVAVVDDQDRIQGFVSARKLLLRYRQELLIQTTW